MKFSVLLSLVFATASFAANVDIVKVFDGTVGSCSNGLDAAKHVFQAYNVVSISLGEEGDDVDLSFDLEMVECKKTEEGYKFLSVDPWETFRYPVFLGRDEDGNILWNNVTAVTTSIEGITEKDGKLRKISSKNKSKTLSFTVKLSEMLSSDDLGTYASGQPVEGSMDFNLVRVFELYGSNGTHDIHSVSYGAFRFPFEISRQAGKAKLRILK